MVLSILLVVNGLLLLPLAAEWLVMGSVAVARRFHIPELIIGLSIVALGTSAPELVIAIRAALEGEGGIVLGNAVGSNIANLGLVLGLAALLRRIPVSRGVLWLDGPLMIAATLAAFWLIYDGLLSRADGYILLGGLVVMTAFDGLRGRFKWLEPKQNTGAELEQKGAPSNQQTWHSLILILLGLGGLVFGASMLVRGATSLAEIFGVSGTFIGATVVALGTSAPELAATIAAVRHRRYGLMLGNLLGSCRFNLLAILGVPALITTLRPGASMLLLHLPALVVVALAAWLFLMSERSIRRSEGALLLVLYIAYICLTFLYQ